MAFSGPRLEEVLSGRDNNLNAIRMIAAVIVLVSHAFAITLNTADPLFKLTGETAGHYAVGVFFGISGLLIARSFDRRRTMVHFVIARVLRLYPALIVVLVLTVLAGVVVTRLPAQDYITHPETWTYVPANLSLQFLQYPLPGVFEANPYGPAINGSLWTLEHEVACYGAVVVIGLLGVLRSRRLAFGVMVFAALFHVLWPTIAAAGLPFPAALAIWLGPFALLSFPFTLGSFAYVWRAHLRLSGWVAVLLWLPVPFMVQTGLGHSFITLALVYTALWIGFVPKGRALAYNRLGDYSYGVYIYAFPVQQLLVWLFPGMGPLANIVLALPVTIMLAALSWNLVEARSLALATPLADRVAQQIRKPAPGAG